MKEMKTSNEYTCPICKQGYITIEKERTGPLGFRETDYDITNKTCECITYDCELIALAIMGYKDEKYIKNETCESCGEREATINYPIKPWAGEYKKICPNCFQIEMDQLKGENGEK